MADMPEDKTASTEAGAEAQAPASAANGAERVALTHGLGGIVGVKAGMTQIYTDEGRMQAVTVIDLRPAVITQIKTKEKDGYQAVQVGFLEKRTKRVTKPEAGHVKASGGKAFLHYQEFRLPENAKLDALKVGMVLSPEFLSDGDLVDLTSTSKGKGFQGTMKRYNFSGGPASHGASVVHRMPGSIGNRADPSKVFKGKKMAGQMGNKRVTVQNVKVVRVDAEKGLLLVHGSVPGPKSGVVTVRRAVKEAERKGTQLA